MARSNTGSTSNWYSNANAVATVEPLTMACWFNTSSLTTTMNLMTIGNAAGSQYASLIYDGNNEYALGDNKILADPGSSTSNSAATTGTIGSTGVWNHVGAVFTSSTSRNAYLNGTASTTNTASRAIGTVTQTNLGAYRVGSTSFGPLNGLMAEAAIWNVALGAAEFAMLAKGVSPLLVRPKQIVAYWPLWGRTTTEPDYRGNFPLTQNGTMSQAAHPIIIYGAGGFIGTASSGSTANADGSASGTGAATGVGASTAASPASASGVGAATGVGASNAASTASASGTGAAAGVGASTADSAGSSAGTGTASGVGASLAAATASASGTGTATGISPDGSVGAISATGTATGVGASQAAGVGSITGAGTATAFTPDGSVGAISGLGTASGVGAALSAAVGSVTGSASADGVSNATAIEDPNNSPAAFAILQLLLEEDEAKKEEEAPRFTLPEPPQADPEPAPKPVQKPQKAAKAKAEPLKGLASLAVLLEAPPAPSVAASQPARAAKQPAKAAKAAVKPAEVADKPVNNYDDDEEALIALFFA